MTQLVDQTVLVTGANRGIGREFVRQLLDRGVAKVYAAARDPRTVVADDPQGTLLAAPTNVCFAGAKLDRIVCANLGRWHLTAIDDTGLRGVPLHRPGKEST